MNDFKIRKLMPSDRKWVRQLMIEHWRSEKVVSRGVIHEPHKLNGFAAFMDNRPVGLLTYNIIDRNCEIVTLDSLVENRGIGSALLEEVCKAARQAGCDRLWLITTNDNIHAIRFYQRRGFTIAAIHCNEINKSRELKPEIPLMGNEAIPIRDEIEFEIKL